MKKNKNNIVEITRGERKEFESDESADAIHIDEIEDVTKDSDDEAKKDDEEYDSELQKEEAEYIKKHDIKRKNLLGDDDDEEVKE